MSVCARARWLLKDDCPDSAVTMAADRAGAYESKFDSDGIEALTKKLTADLRKHIRALVRSFRWCLRRPAVYPPVHVSLLSPVRPLVLFCGCCARAASVLVVTPAHGRLTWLWARQAAHEVLSPRWMQMAQSLARIGFISQKEAAMPKDKADSTLWECEELALRCVLARVARHSPHPYAHRSPPLVALCRRYLLEDGKLNLCVAALNAAATGPAWLTVRALAGACGSWSSTARRSRRSRPARARSLRNRPRLWPSSRRASVSC